MLDKGRLTLQDNDTSIRFGLISDHFRVSFSDYSPRANLMDLNYCRELKTYFVDEQRVYYTQSYILK